jgi:hypothetical protein
VICKAIVAIVAAAALPGVVRFAAFAGIRRSRK